MSEVALDDNHTMTVRQLKKTVKGNLDSDYFYYKNSPLALSSVSVVEETELVETKKKRITDKHKARETGIISDKFELSYVNGQDALEKVAAAAGVKLADLTTKFKPPYNQEFLDVLIDVGENDDVIDSLLSLISWAAVGQPKTHNVYPKGLKDYSDEKQIQKDLNKIGFNKENIEKFLTFVREVEYDIDLDSHALQAVYDAMLGGRTGLLIEKYTKDNKNKMPVDTPAILKPMAFKNMGQNLCMKNSWRVKFIENLDVALDQDDRWLDVNDMIYFAFNDSNRNPGKLTYGRSVCHAMVKYSNILRQIMERDVPEIVTSFWMKPGILKTPDGMDPNTKQSMIDNMYQGGLIVINEHAEFEAIDLKHDGWYLAKVYENVVDAVCERLRVPRFFRKYEAASRSVVESAVNVFRDFTIAPIQRWAVSILKKQFYYKLLEIFVRENDIDEEVLNKVEIVVHYEPFSIEDLLSKANSIELLIRRDVITIREARKMMRLPEKRQEDLEADIEARVKQQQTMIEISLMAQQATGQGQQINSNQNPNSGIPASNGTPVPTLDKNVNQMGIKSQNARLNARPAARAGAGRTRTV